MKDNGFATRKSATAYASGFMVARVVVRIGSRYFVVHPSTAVRLQSRGSK